MIKFDELSYLRRYYGAAHRAWIFSAWGVVALTVVSTTATWTGYETIGWVTLCFALAMCIPFLVFFFNYTPASSFVDIDREAIQKKVEKLFNDEAAGGGQDGAA